MQKLQYKQEKKLIIEKVTLKNTNITSPSETAIKIESEGEFDSANEQPATPRDQSAIQRDHSVTFKDQSSANLNITGHIQDKTIPTTSRNQDFITKNMEERAKQREQIRKEREVRKKKIEQEKFESFRREQEEKLRVESEEKRRKQLELKDILKLQT